MTLRISVTSANGDKFASFDVDGSTTIETLKLLILSELNISIEKQIIIYKNMALSNKQTLVVCGVQNNDMLTVIEGGPQNLPAQLMRNPTALQEYIQGNPQLLQLIIQNNPAMAQAVLAPNAQALTTYLQQQAQQEELRRRQQAAEIQRLNDDPLNPQAQAAIAENIRQENVRNNMELAIEYNPEAFAQVLMLYVPCRVNNQEVNAFVDSGAQTTIMSKAVAERCNIMRLIDTRFAGIAKGVGSAKTLGRIHAVPLRLGNSVFQCALTIMDSDDMPFLLGLDQLRRYQACINLKQNILEIGDEKIPFLSEKDLQSADKFISPTHQQQLRQQRQFDEERKQQQQQQQQVQPPPTAQSQLANNVNTPELTQLMSFGFNALEAAQALAAFNNDVDRAASFLFSQQGTF